MTAESCLNDLQKYFQCWWLGSSSFEHQCEGCLSCSVTRFFATHEIIGDLVEQAEISSYCIAVELTLEPELQVAAKLSLPSGYAFWNYLVWLWPYSEGSAIDSVIAGRAWKVLLVQLANPQWRFFCRSRPVKASIVGSLRSTWWTDSGSLPQANP